MCARAIVQSPMEAHVVPSALIWFTPEDPSVRHFGLALDAMLPQICISYVNVSRSSGLLL